MNDAKILTEQCKQSSSFLVARAETEVVESNKAKQLSDAARLRGTAVKYLCPEMEEQVSSSGRFTGRRRERLL